MHSKIMCPNSMHTKLVCNGANLSNSLLLTTTEGNDWNKYPSSQFQTMFPSTARYMPFICALQLDAGECQVPSFACCTKGKTPFQFQTESSHCWYCQIEPCDEVEAFVLETK